MAGCCISAGGIVTLAINGELYALRGSVTVMASNVERSEGSNIDGSTYVTSKPVPPTIEMTLSDRCGLSLINLLNLPCGSDAVVEMPEVGRTMVLVNATLVGRPSLNPEDGAISGLKLVGSRMREILDDPV